MKGSEAVIEGTCNKTGGSKTETNGGFGFEGKEESQPDAKQASGVNGESKIEGGFKINVGESKEEEAFDVDIENESKAGTEVGFVIGSGDKSSAGLVFNFEIKSKVGTRVGFNVGSEEILKIEGGFSADTEKKSKGGIGVVFVSYIGGGFNTGELFGTESGIKEVLRDKVESRVKDKTKEESRAESEGLNKGEFEVEGDGSQELEEGEFRLCKARKACKRRLRKENLNNLTGLSSSEIYSSESRILRLGTTTEIGGGE